MSKELDIRKIDRLERQFLQKSMSILSKETVSKKEIEKLHIQFESMMKSIDREPLHIYRNIEIILRGTNYNLNSSLEANISYMRQILAEEENNTIKTALIGTLAMIATAERVDREREVNRLQSE